MPDMIAHGRQQLGDQSLEIVFVHFVKVPLYLSTRCLFSLLIGRLTFRLCFPDVKLRVAGRIIVSFSFMFDAVRPVCRSNQFALGEAQRFFSGSCKDPHACIFLRVAGFDTIRGIESNLRVPPDCPGLGCLSLIFR